MQIENNAMYQAQLRTIRAAHDSHLHNNAAHFKGDIHSFQRTANRKAEEANVRASIRTQRGDIY